MNRRKFMVSTTRAGIAATASLSLSPLTGVALAADNHAAQIGASDTAGRQQTIRVLSAGAPNTLDPQGEGVSRESLGLFTNVYDRLIAFDQTPLPGSAAEHLCASRYDYHHFKGELATHFESQKDETEWVFHLRQDATFHDGKPVTADAVKWSLDRAVTLPASKQQLATGSLTTPAQFVVEDPFTLRVVLPRADRYALPNLALPFTSIVNAALLKTQASSTDPWATAWLRNHAAGGGAFEVSDWQSGRQVAYRRFERWKSGPIPRVARALVQSVPDATNRLAALERGDTDIALQLSAQEFGALKTQRGVATLSVPVTNTFRFLAFNTTEKPFDDVRVRQAIAYAIPYHAIFDGVANNRGTPLFSNTGNPPDPAHIAPDTQWPQPYPYGTVLSRATALLAQAGYPNGFNTTFSYSVSDATVAEPSALLIQDALRALSINLTLQKVDSAQWGALQTQKRLPFFIDSSSAWFDDPDYFYRIFFEGNWRWNFGSFNNPALVKLTDAARWETRKPVYDHLMQDAARVVISEIPILPLWQPSFDLATRSDIRGFTYYIHAQVDFRTLYRASGAGQA